MTRTGAFVLGVSLFVTACSPSRQAAWEKKSVEELAAPVRPTESAGDANKPAAPAQKLDTAGEQPSDPAILAQQAWVKRDDRASLEKAIALWEKIAADSEPNAELLSMLSRAYYLLGETHHRLAGDNEAMLADLEKGVMAGERAMMAASPAFAARVEAGDRIEDAIASIPNEGQPAIYWYASNLGRLALAKGVTTTLLYANRILTAMQRVLSIDETFFCAAPHRYLGVFHATAPTFAGGDLDKSRAHFERALELAPDYLGTKVLFAECYAPKRDDRKLFTRLLNEVAAADPSVIAGLEPEQRLEQEKARRLLTEVDEIF